MAMLCCDTKNIQHLYLMFFLSSSEPYYHRKLIGAFNTPSTLTSSVQMAQKYLSYMYLHCYISVEQIKRKLRELKCVTISSYYNISSDRRQKLRKERDSGSCGSYQSYKIVNKNFLHFVFLQTIKFRVYHLLLKLLLFGPSVLLW